MALTRRQKEVLDFISNFLDRHGYSPSYDEIAKGLSLASLATVHKHISALDAKHYIKRSVNRSRSVELTRKHFDEQQRARAAELEIPLAGRIAAGAPVESVEERESLKLSEFTGEGRDTFALEVRGDSMIEDHILSGDYVLVERTPEVRDGDIVVALVSGMETTLKRFYREGPDTVRLQPANAAMEPIRVPVSDLEVQGRVLAVLRKYR